MKKTLYIVLGAILLVACSTVNTPPIDDAYIYPEKTTPVSAAPTKSVSSEVATPAAKQAQEAATPSMEIVSQKDTTITVRIKR